MLDGNPLGLRTVHRLSSLRILTQHHYFLGHFAVKKIAVGQSHTYLLQILREVRHKAYYIEEISNGWRKCQVRLLERLHHPNIITYHHAWLETSQFSAFGPKVPTLQLSSSPRIALLGRTINARPYWLCDVCSVLMQWAEGGRLVISNMLDSYTSV